MTVAPTPALPAENIYGHTKKLLFLIEHVKREVEAKGKVRLLDFGCGNGSAVSQYLMLPGVEYYGVDIHEPSLEYARKHFGGPDRHFVDRVPTDAAFDLLVYSDNLEHLDHPDEILCEHVKFLASGGKVLGAIPNGFGPFEIENRIDRRLSLQSRVDKLIRKIKSAPVADEPAAPYNHESGHLQFFTQGSLRNVLAKAGLEITEFRKGAFVGAPLSDRLLLRRGPFVRWNVRIADFLPRSWVSTWYFVAQRRAS
jgi:2-polyprenyl-3-methyl-5-hydroxy-6-metoxy-1,4-benzoquinol methylase